MPSISNAILPHLPSITGLLAGGIVIASGGSPLQSGMALLATGIGGYGAASIAGSGQSQRLGQLEQTRKNLEEQLDRERKAQKIAGELDALVGQYQQKRQEFERLENKKEELQKRIAAIQQKFPNLEELEQRQQELAKIKKFIDVALGELNAVQETIAVREKQRDSLQELSARAVQKQTEIQELNQRLDLLNHQAAELELFRNLYDALKQEKNSLDNEKQHLEAELPRLKQEYDRIIANIEQIETKAQEADSLHRELERLEAEIRAKSGVLASIKRKITQLEAEKGQLEIEIAERDKVIQQKKKELQDIKDEIRDAKSERDAAENNKYKALESLKEPIIIAANQRRDFASEADFLANFKQYLTDQGLVFPERVINAFHTSLKVQDISALVILAGISGTGKSQLPQAYAKFIGAPLVILPVQPRWDSPQDLQGFYNYIEKKYKPTDLMHYLYQYQYQANLKNRVVMVLLDEMNLAKVEYYFSDFLSKLENRKDNYLKIDAGSLALTEKEKEVRIPDQFLFIGTMNEDETTQVLSDKVLDRANVLTFGKPSKLELRDGQKSTQSNSTEYLSWESFNAWRKIPVSNSPLTEEVKDYVDRANTIMEKLGHPFAHRVFQAFTKYVQNYPDAEHNDQKRKQAIADQFGQKLLPKLRGIMLDDFQNELDELENLLTELGDETLNKAFQKAKKGQYGQFQWKGMIYEEDTF